MPKIISDSLHSFFMCIKSFFLFNLQILFSHLTSTTTTTMAYQQANYPNVWMNSSRPNYPNAWMNPRKEGEFVTEQRCSCPTSQLYAIKFNKVKCKLMNETNQGCEICCIGMILCMLFAILLMLFTALAAIRYDSGAIIGCIIVSVLIIVVLILYTVFSEFTHTALEALYKCRSCGHEVHKTYELLPQPFGCAGGDIFNDCGRYTRTCQEPEPLKLSVTAYAAIERAYHDMSACYNQCCCNSDNWTEQFIDRLR